MKVLKSWILNLKREIVYQSHKQTRNCVSKMRNLVLKMMNLAAARMGNAMKLKHLLKKYDGDLDFNWAASEDEQDNPERGFTPFHVAVRQFSMEES